MGIIFDEGKRIFKQRTGDMRYMGRTQEHPTGGIGVFRRVKDVAPYGFLCHPERSVAKSKDPYPKSSPQGGGLGSTPF